mgnify:CR=1 FL=1
MLAEVTVAFHRKHAELVMKRGEKIVERESWTFPAISKTEAKEVSASIFHDVYDFLNICVHGDPEESES